MHGRGAEEQEAAEAKGEDDEQAEEEEEEYERPPLLSFSNTDMAFAGDVLVAGSSHGFNVYQLQDDGVPSLMSSIVCPGGQGDVSIVGDLLIMSVQDSRARIDCGLEGVDGRVNEERFRGLRIFDISDLSAPRQVAAIHGLHDRGMKFWDYGNAFLLECSRAGADIAGAPRWPWSWSGPTLPPFWLLGGDTRKCSYPRAGTERRIYGASLFGPPTLIPRSGTP